MKQWGEEWFGEWFNSPYYHILYKNRDDKEARFFINHLVKHLKISKYKTLLDIACGQGRHAVYLNKLGYTVDGIDLSSSSIENAKAHENDSLHFYEHDMRNIFRNNHYDYAFNLFTSFGYFENEGDNQKAITAISNSLKAQGIFVLDFLNPYKVINQLVKEEVKVVEDIEFHIVRSFDGSHIIKDIKFEADARPFHFQEKVKAIRRLDFLSYFRQANLAVSATFGDYSLGAYKAETSDRMIFITRKF